MVPRLPTGFLVSGGTLILPCQYPFRLQDYTYYGVSSHTLLLKILNQLRSPQPQRYCYLWFGLFPFRSPLLRKSMFLSLPPSYLDVSVQRVSSTWLCIYHAVIRYCRTGFPHLGYLRVYGYLLLTAAFRSLSRPSSAPDAKSFSLRLYSLTNLVFAS